MYNCQLSQDADNDDAPSSEDEGPRKKKVLLVSYMRCTHQRLFRKMNRLLRSLPKPQLLTHFITNTPVKTDAVHLTYAGRT